MHFDNRIGKRRLLDLKNMDVNDAENYYLQVSDTKEIDISEFKERIKKAKNPKSCISILAIKTKEGKVVGKMEIFDMKSTAYLTINIPNESWSFKYGEEAIDQFVKICKKRQYFKIIEIEKNNPIIERYVTSRGITDYQIRIA